MAQTPPLPKPTTILLKYMTKAILDQPTPVNSHQPSSRSQTQEQASGDQLSLAEISRGA